MLRISPTSTTGTPIFETTGDADNGWTIYFDIGDGETLLVNGYLGNFNNISTLSGIYTNESNTPFTRIFMPEANKVIVIDVANGEAIVSELRFSCAVCDMDTPVTFFIIGKKLYMFQAFPTECVVIDILENMCYYHHMDYWPNSGIIILAAGAEYIICRIKETMCSFTYLMENYNVNLEKPIKNTTSAAVVVESANAIRIVDGDNINTVVLPFLASPDFHYIDIPLETI
jgi:hypothetical protein